MAVEETVSLLGLGEVCRSLLQGQDQRRLSIGLPLEGEFIGAQCFPDPQLVQQRSAAGQIFAGGRGHGVQGVGRGGGKQRSTLPHQVTQRR